MELNAVRFEHPQPGLDHLFARRDRVRRDLCARARDPEVVGRQGPLPAAGDGPLERGRGTARDCCAERRAGRAPYSNFSTAHVFRQTFGRSRFTAKCLSFEALPMLLVLLQIMLGMDFRGACKGRYL